MFDMIAKAKWSNFRLQNRVTNPQPWLQYANIEITNYFVTILILSQEPLDQYQAYLHFLKYLIKLIPNYGIGNLKS